MFRDILNVDIKSCHSSFRRVVLLHLCRAPAFCVAADSLHQTLSAHTLQIGVERLLLLPVWYHELFRCPWSGVAKWLSMFWFVHDQSAFIYDPHSNRKFLSCCNSQYDPATIISVCVQLILLFISLMVLRDMWKAQPVPAQWIYSGIKTSSVTAVARVSETDIINPGTEWQSKLPSSEKIFSSGCFNWLEDKVIAVGSRHSSPEQTVFSQSSARWCVETHPHKDQQKAR